jgi:hypothetical protein
MPQRQIRKHSPCSDPLCRALRCKTGKRIPERAGVAQAMTAASVSKTCRSPAKSHL